MKTLNYLEIISKHPWIVKKDQDCILSPDSDGLLCGLFMSHHLNWHIRGFYDGKVLVVEQGINPKNCVFLDMEIYRKGVKSIGQHMIMYDKKNPIVGWDNFNDCISANNIREYDFKSDFKLKYPLGTIHILMAIVSKNLKVPIKKSAIAPLLYTDGTFKNQFNYPENCLSWLEFFDTSNGNPLGDVFMNEHYSVYELMVELKDLFSEINKIGGGKRGGDKIKLSNSGGNLVNIDNDNNTINTNTKNQAELFISMLSNKTGWIFKKPLWSWGPYSIKKFKKGNIKPGKARYLELLNKSPLSLAIISRNSIEYTLDTNKEF